jgi:hypothetical protein
MEIRSQLLWSDSDSDSHQCVTYEVQYMMLYILHKYVTYYVLVWGAPYCGIDWPEYLCALRMSVCARMCAVLIITYIVCVCGHRLMEGYV